MTAKFMMSKRPVLRVIVFSSLSYFRPILIVIVVGLGKGAYEVKNITFCEQAPL